MLNCSLHRSPTQVESHEIKRMTERQKHCSDTVVFALHEFVILDRVASWGNEEYPKSSLQIHGLRGIILQCGIWTILCNFCAHLHGMFLKYYNTKHKGTAFRYKIKNNKNLAVTHSLILALRHNTIIY